jgi:hypothetical protein
LFVKSSRRRFIRAAGFSATPAFLPGPSTAAPADSNRQYWLEVLVRLAEPILTALSERKLKAVMPVEAHAGVTDRREYTYLEALGRVLVGISPWLESGGREGKEGELRTRYASHAREAIAAAVDPASPDFMNFNRGSQPVVDSAFLALALLRAPTELWKNLPSGTKAQLIKALQSSRVIRPSFSNWLLFSATVEVFLGSVGESWDPMRVDYAVRQHEQWYKGDGLYGDGPQFHWDYYNSFVIHPMLLQVLDTAAGLSNAWDVFRRPVETRARRYAAIQERLISPEGTFPAIGRSLAYRCGAFHLLADISLRRKLPDELAPEQVRAALTSVLHKTMDAPQTFDAKGWLTIGFCGHQPEIGENYISTGSTYLCSTVLLPLGLPASDAFWSGPEKAWSAKKIWSGESVPADHALPPVTAS